MAQMPRLAGCPNLSMGLSADIPIHSGGSLGAKAKHVEKRASPLLASASVLVVRLPSAVGRRGLLPRTEIVHDGAPPLLEGLGRGGDHDLQLEVLNVVVRLDLCAAAVGEAGAGVEDVAAEGAGEGRYDGALLTRYLQGLLAQRLGVSLALPVRVRDDGMEEDELVVAREVRLLRLRDA